MKFSLDIKRSEQLANICGSLDKNLENIANNLNVTISNKGADFNIKGNNAAEAVSVLQDLLLISEKKTIDFSDIDLSIKSLNSPNGDAPSITIKTSKKHIHIRSGNQQKYVNAILENDAVFAVGPAGTGKTYLAVARAVEALENSNVKRIVLVRPAVELVKS
jgi:phosphate starvation-inducible PhoH-like protein